MIVEHRAFIWDASKSEFGIFLGNKKSELLERNLIYQEKESPNYFRTFDERNIILDFDHNEKVNRIMINREAVIPFLELDVFNLRESFEYPYTEPIVKFLSEKYGTPLPAKTMDEIKKLKGDILHIIFSDFNPRNMFVHRFL